MLHPTPYEHLLLHTRNHERQIKKKRHIFIKRCMRWKWIILIYKSDSRKAERTNKKKYTAKQWMVCIACVHMYREYPAKNMLRLNVSYSIENIKYNNAPPAHHKSFSSNCSLADSILFLISLIILFSFGCTYIQCALCSRARTHTQS